MEWGGGRTGLRGARPNRVRRVINTLLRSRPSGNLRERFLDRKRRTLPAPNLRAPEPDRGKCGGILVFVPAGCDADVDAWMVASPLKASQNRAAGPIPMSASVLYQQRAARLMAAG